MKNIRKTYYKVFRTGSFILSALTWGILGIGIDLGTGASYKPDHKGEASITKENDKDYTFNLEYHECKN